MQKKVTTIIKNNYLLLFLLVYGIFLIFYKWSGSLMGDESTYSEIAKEMLLDKHFLVPHWKQQLWFEKPPLVLWLTMLSFKLFGISETSAHIFPGIFGILSSITLYFTGKQIFKSKLAGFFAGFIFLSTPIIVTYDRTLMMDIPVGLFISFCALSILKLNTGEKDYWWLSYFISMGLGVLTKSIVGLLPLVFLLPYFFSIKFSFSFLKNKYFQIGTIVFLKIILPWHIFMSLNFGALFWDDYIGFHVIKRLSVQIFQYPWENGSNIGYVKLLLFRTGIWFWLFLVFFLTTLAAILKRKVPPAVSKWIHSHEKNLLFLLFWTFISAFPFFISSTKLPNYMVLVFFPISVFTGGFLAKLFSNKQASALLCILSLMVFSSTMRLHASDFGESHYFIPKFFIRFFNFNDNQLFIISLNISLCIAIYYFKSIRTHLFQKNMLALFIFLNLLVPFNPLRNEFLKKMGQDIAQLSANRPVTLYYKIKPDQYSFNCVGAFYLPIHSQLIDLEKNDLSSQSINDSQLPTFCFTERSFVDEKYSENILKSYSEGILSDCKSNK